MSNEHIWIVEDEEDILALVSYNLQKAGYAARTFVSGEEALAALDGALPDLLILDLMLGGIDGRELCRRLRQDSRTRGVPVLMLTALAEDEDVVRGFETGADDYMTKPFSPKVLLARVKAVLRRGKEKGSSSTLISLAGLRIDSGRHEATLDGAALALTASEFRLLAHLASRPGQVFNRDQLVEAVHDGHVAVTDRTVDVMIVSLRKKLGNRKELVETVRGVGYRFREQARP